MTAITGPETATTDAHAAHLTVDDQFLALGSRAAALAGSATKIADADALVADIVRSNVPEAVFKALADAMGKATGFDAKDYLAQMNRGRTAAKQTGAGMGMSGTQNPDPTPSPDGLDRVLDVIVRAVERQVVCGPHAAAAVALWIAGTYGFKGGPIYPRLVLTSPTKRCGKSTLLGTVAAMSCTPVKADNVTASSVFRLIDHWRPTLLIDEVDAFFAASNELRGVVNAGYERSGNVLRSVESPDGKSFVPSAFKVYCPMALAGIGSLPDTVLDRSIVITLTRAPSRSMTKRPTPLRYRGLEALRDLIAPQLVAHATAIETATAAGTKVMPPGLSDRAQDNWEPLLALADLAGGSWPACARAAALALSGGADAQSQREMLLEDLNGIVKVARSESVSAYRAWRSAGRAGARPTLMRHVRSATLVAELLKMEHRPWPEFGKDCRGMTPQRMANLLGPFKLQSVNTRLPVAGRQPLAARGRTGTNTEVVKTYSVRTLRAAYRQYGT